MENYYEILKIDRDASLKDIKKAYAKLVRQYPPETHPEDFKKIRKAYEALINGETYEEQPLTSDFKYNNDLNGYDDSFYKNENEFEIEINPQSDYRQVLDLYEYYYNNMNYQKAIEILNLAIDRKNTLSSNNTIYYLQLITTHVNSRDLHNLNNVLYEFLKDIQLTKGNNRGEYIFNELKNISIDLYNKKEFTYAQAIAYMILRLNPKDQRLNSMLNLLNRLEKNSIIFNRLNKDSLILDCLKQLIYLYLDDQLTYEEKQYRLHIAKINIDNVDKKELSKSLKRLTSYYYDLCNIDHIYFRDLEKRLNRELAKPLLFRNYPSIIFVIIFPIMICILSIAILAFSDTENNTSNPPLSASNNYQQMNTPKKINVYQQPKVDNASLPITAVIKKMTVIPYGYKFKLGTFGYTTEETGNSICQRAVTSDEDAENLLKQYKPNFLTLTYTNGTSTITFSAIITAGIDYIDSKNLGSDMYEVNTYGDKEFCYVDTGKEKKILFRENLNGEGYKFMPDVSNKNLNNTPFVLYTITSNSTVSNTRNELVASAESVR